jgi:hypothetical protein
VARIADVAGKLVLRFPMPVFAASVPSGPDARAQAEERVREVFRAERASNLFTWEEGGRFWAGVARKASDDSSIVGFVEREVAGGTYARKEISQRDPATRARTLENLRRQHRVDESRPTLFETDWRGGESWVLLPVDD